ncbi:MAG: VIT and VWA domain-containing protein, partial [Alphaproteobacteria bacterium]|nr:VIT and VWA domain-containing protein [Alphaproteobacteria bacterium]
MRFFTQFLIVIVAFWPFAALAQAGAEDVAGRILGQIDGRQVELPMLTSDYDIDIQGDLATVTLTQTFENPYSAAMSAEYLFPLHRKAAVYAMTMEVGDERVRAQIQEKKEAEQVFAAAEAEGKAAALLTQHRPNMFTQRVANLMPGLPVTVSLSYVQTVPRIDGAYELVVPLVVGPRYEGAQTPEPEPVPQGAAQAGWTMSSLPDYPQVMGLDLPDHVAPDRVSLDLSLASAVPVVSLTSATHALSLTSDDQALSAQFEAGRVIDNRDLVLRYVLGGETLSSGVLTHLDDRGGFLSLMIEPPSAPDVSDAMPREIVFVLDTSGSMNGLPIAASKRFMAAALEGLRPGDFFRIISFSNEAEQFSDRAIPATEANRKAGLSYVRRL